MKIWKKPFVSGVFRVIYGYLFCEWMRLKYGRETYLLLICGKPGEIYLYFRYLKSFFEEKHIKNYLLIGCHRNVEDVKKLYPNLPGEVITVSERTWLSMQTACSFFGEDRLKIIPGLLWNVDRPINRCAVRLTTPFNLIESYIWFLFGLDDQIPSPTKANFRLLTKDLKSQLKGQGIKEKRTVVMSPLSECVRPLPVIFWRLLGKDLMRRGYKVFVMLDERFEQNDFGFPCVFKHIDSISILEYAGYFIGLYGDFCHFIPEAHCKKIILYSTYPSESLGTSHRTDKIFSGIIQMGLKKNAEEITVPFARNEIDFTPENEDFFQRITENKALIQKILSLFPAHMIIK